MNRHLKTIIALVVVANIAVLALLLLRDTDEAGPRDLGEALTPLVADPTMESARFELDPDLNVILISLDALRFDRTGPGPDGRSNTPNLDAFAQEAISFTNVTSAASWTLPSHMSVWTARWPSVHGVTNKFKLLGNDQMAETQLSPGIETYPALLARRGWTAAAFTGGAGMSGRYGFDRGFDPYVDDRPFAGLDYSAPQAARWLREHRDGKVLLYVHGYDSHGMYPVSEAAIDALDYAGSLDGSVDENARLREQGLAAIDAPGEAADLTGVLGEDDARFLSDLYDKRVRAADERLGTFLSEVRAMGLMDKSIIVVMSDHGDEYMDRGAIDHGHTLYQEQVHTVLMMRLPGYTKHRDIDAVVRSVDLFPTVFDLLGQPGPEGVDGTSLVPLLRGEPLELTAFSETDYRLFVHHRVIRKGSYKLILDLMDGGRELYDLAQDPGETRDISGSEPRRTYELEQELRGWMMTHGHNPEDYRGIEHTPITVF